MRMANSVARVTNPCPPASLKRKSAALELQEDGSDRARRAKIWNLMNPYANRPALTEPAKYILFSFCLTRAHVCFFFFLVTGYLPPSREGQQCHRHQPRTLL